MEVVVGRAAERLIFCLSQTQLAQSMPQDPDLPARCYVPSAALVVSSFSWHGMDLIFYVNNKQPSLKSKSLIIFNLRHEIYESVGVANLEE